MSEHSTAIEARNIDFFYSENQVLFDVSLKVPERSVTALIGPSGVRKEYISPNAQPHERPD